MFGICNDNNSHLIFDVGRFRIENLDKFSFSSLVYCPFLPRIMTTSYDGDLKLLEGYSF